MKWAIGLDVGGTKVAGALVSSAGAIRGFETSPIQGKGELGVQAVLAAAQRLLAFARNESLAIEGIGVGVPGAVDIDAGIVLNAPNLNWTGLPLRTTFETALGVPVEVELDVRAAALGALATDLARGIRDFVYVTIGTGFGAGIVINGELYRGFNSCSGEIGHCVVVDDGPRCGCGQQGCLEALAAGPAIAERVRSLVCGNPSISARFAVDGVITAKEVFEAAEANDPLACEAVRRTAVYIGRGLSFLINILNPQAIILGGGVTKGGERLLQLIRQYAAHYTLHQQSKQTEILLCPDAAHLPVIGAANLIFQRQRRRIHD